MAVLLRDLDTNEEVDLFPIERPFLGIRDRVPLYCEGFPEAPYCGDEKDDPDQKYCASCQRQADRKEDRKAWERDGHAPLVAYPHLTD